MKAPYCQHVHIICRDMKKMIDFWVNGFSANVEEYRKFSGDDGAILDIGMTAKLYLKEVHCVHEPESPRRSGIEHIGMIVADLDETLEKLKKNPDVKILGDCFMSEPVRCVYIEGPEGLMVEIMQFIA